MIVKNVKFRAYKSDEGMITSNVDCFLSVNSDGSLNNNSLITETIVMQFTGLQDRNGQDIYEGDVIYLAGYGNYIAEFPFLELYEAYNENDIGEIQGNIYENPELNQ